MPERLTHTVALITGASSGIGRDTAVRLAAAGASVTLVARRQDDLRVLADSIGEAGGTALVFDGDISNSDTAAAAVDATIARFGRLDTVVNAAGVMLIGESIGAPLEHWERMVDVNLKGLMFITKAALPHLVDAAVTSGRGVADLVNISSTAGRVVTPYTALYNATKFAVTAATESWRQEYATRSVRVSVIEPGAVDTELGHHQDATQDWYDQLSATGDILSASDVADAVAYIVTNPARVAVGEIVIRPTQQV